MSRLSFRRIIRRPIALLPLIINLALFLPQSASAELYTTTGANDFYFTTESEQLFTVRAYAWEYGIDSMLWLYDANNQLLAANDDYFGLDSYISIMLPAGTYRVRTGVCCGDPDRWYGTSYQIDTNFAVVGGVAVTTTTQEPTTTTIQETTTTVEASTTTEAPPTTETTESPTTVPESTTTSTENLPTSTEPEPTTTTSELPPTSVTQPDVPVTDAPTTSLVDDTTTTQAPEPTLPPETTTSSTSTSTTIKVPTATTQPVVVATTTTTTSEPAPRSEQVGSTTTVTPTTTTLPPVLPELSPTEAVSLALSSEVIQNVTPEQAAQIFGSLDTGALTNEQAAQLVAVVQGASEEVRKEFENSVNIFDTKFETYVPVGSNVNVKTRKVIIAATGVLFVAPTISTSPPPAPTGGPSGGSGGSPSGSTNGESTGSDEKRQSRRGRK